MTTTMTLEGETGLLLTRDCAASAEALFRGLTEPDLLKRWMASGGGGWSLVKCSVEAKPEGSFHYVWRNAKARKSLSMKGVFTAFERPTLLDIAQVVEDDEFLDEEWITYQFEQLEAGTRLTMLLQYETQEERDEVAASGIESRTEETLARLDATVAGL